LIVLGIETATSAGSVALVSENEVLAEYLLNNMRSHAEQVLRGIDHIIADTGRSLEECEAIAVSIGPGAFTGLRIGVSTAKALAYAIHKPILGISTLEALAWNLPFISDYVCPMLDARKKEVYTALYQWVDRKLKVLIPEQAVSPLTMINHLDRSQKILFLGSGSILYAKMICAEFGEKAEFPPLYHSFPRASIIASLGLNRLVLQQFDNVETLVPTYLRLSDAEINWAKKHDSQYSLPESNGRF